MSEAHSHFPPTRTYVVVFVALLAGMVLTVAAAEFGNLPSLAANLVAMSIAIAKASLVVMYFMGVKFSTRLTQVYAMLGFVWVTLLGITFCDYASRQFEPMPSWVGDKTYAQTDVVIVEKGKEPGRQYYGSP